MFTPRGPETLREIADGVHAYLQQGSWGFNNAGLVNGKHTALLVDTLYDVPSTARMLQAMRPLLSGAARIDTVVNTHANGDHCWGNQAVGASTIVSSRAAAEEMLELRPALMFAMVSTARALTRTGPTTRRLLSALGRLGVPRIGPLARAAEFVVDCFGSFEFRGIELTPPTMTFSGRTTLQVGDRRVELIEVGPAHTKGDVVAYLPEERVVFTGDILFIGSHPIVWQGPVRNWIAACDRLLGLDVDVVVPGHGPLTTKEGVRQTKQYWEELVSVVERGRAAGAKPEEIARSFASSTFGSWGEAHRLIVNVDTIYRELAGDTRQPDPVQLFEQMADFERASTRSGSAH